ncbi:hypothetical protein SNE40_014282 [Patella caerulea]|uniref:SAM domain-containing protein n=1 Tax=Patella caerulea TaxID=87958 RepID=A0AAN8JD83_PATCE
MKLEAVNRDNPNQICAATITKIVGHLMWIHLDNSNKMVASHVEDVYSHNLFPVGWCESNGYQLKPPRKTGLKRSTVKRVAIVQPEKSTGDEKVKNEGGMYAKIKKGEAEGSAWCPKIYFNHKCFSGPYLSKARIAELPKCVGPGPINLVMKEVLSMLISVAYKSCRVLRELQMEGPANPTMHQQVLKAKYKTKSYRAVVEICKMNSQLEDFCRQACIKLECCPNLISPHFIDDQCPENCSQLTKTKYTYYYGKKKKKIGRPPGGHSNLENGQKKCGKKKKKINMESRKTRHNSPDVNMIGDGDDDKASIDSDTRTVDSTSTTELKNKSSVKAVKASMRLKRKYIHHIPPPSDIQTRGDKRPRYSFERRTHKKIMISSPYLTGQKSKSSQSTKQSHHSQHSHHAHQSFQKKNIYPVSTIKKEDILKLDKNPLEWTITNVMDFIKSTDCANLSRLFKEQEIDGQALLLLTLPTVQEHLGLKLGPAIKLCHHIERVKIAFYETFAK